MIEANFIKRYYDEKDAIKVLNPLQAAYYWAYGCIPLDIYSSRDYETNKPVIVYVFSRKATQETGVYDKWCNRSFE